MNPPRTADELIAWMVDRKDKEALLRKVKRLGRAFRHPNLITDWTPDQVSSVFHELTVARKDHFPWGGPGP